MLVDPGTGGTPQDPLHVWHKGDPTTGFPGLQADPSTGNVTAKPLTATNTGGNNAGGFNFSTPPYGGPMSPDMSFWTDAPAFTFSNFTAPTGVTEQNDPGYQFRLSQGEQALQQSAAANGAANTGGTMKGLIDYGQNAASQEYQNVFNRALQGYQTNLGTAQAEYAPKFQSWATKMGFDQADALAAFQRQWDAYTFPISNTTQNAAIAAGLSSYVPPAPA